MALKKLPIGIQSFKQLIEQDCVYVDKTELIHRLITDGGTYFLSRPRRFGKSLLISTLKEIFLGNKELFKDTKIYDNRDWSVKYPVIHLSFAAIDYAGMGLDKALEHELKLIAKSFNIIFLEQNYKLMFKELIEQIKEKHGKVVILIDEYDKPIIDYLEFDKLHQAKINQAVMRQFYSVLKDAGENLRFLFIAGVSKFAKVSIFSDLNHLNDISLDKNYATLTGYTQQELEDSFKDYIESACVSMDIEKELLLSNMREWYNGFSWDGKHTVYNPFGILNFFAKGAFRNYWFASGTPTFLLAQMKKYTRFDFENIRTTDQALDKSDLDNLGLEALLFQTGYLTIKKLDILTGDIVLDYPNKEVRDSLYAYLIDGLTQTAGRQTSGVTVQDMAAAFKAGNLESIKDIINVLLSDLPYNTFDKQTEGLYHGLIHILFKYLGVYIRSEVHTHRGRLDSIVETPTDVFIFEFKFNKTPEIALAQIRNKNYAQPYRSSGKKITGIGVNFDTNERAITGWCEEIQ